MKNVAWSMAVFVPSLVAFAIAFHCFLRNDPIFEGPVASVLKTFAMVLGEFNIEGKVYTEIFSLLLIKNCFVMKMPL